MKWEYLKAYYNLSVDNSILDGLGEQGWELVIVLKGQSQYQWIFKREKIEEIKPVGGN